MRETQTYKYLLKKVKKSQVNILTMHVKKVEKQEQTIIKSRRK
jgi:hypothetical protein